MATALAVTVQLGVPVAVLFLIGYLAYLEGGRRDPRTARPGAGARGQASPGADGLGTGAGRPMAVGAGNWRQCWQVKRCRPERRQSCPACRNAGLPCWQARKAACGRLEADCIDCELFLAPPARV